MDRLTAIPLKPSRIALYLHNLVLALSFMALWLCGLPILFKLLFAGGLLLAGMEWQHQQRQLPVSIVDLEKLELVSEQLVLSWLIVLNFRVKEPGEKNNGKKFTLALWPDMAHADDLRRLRVYLRNN